MENNQLSVLVIDKDARSLNFLSALLAKQGHNVQAVAGGKEGYISALRDHPDIVVFDYMGGSFTLANNQHLPILQKMPNDTAAIMLDQVSRQIVETAHKAHG